MERQEGRAARIQPTPVYQVTSEGNRIRSFFDPSTGHREAVEISDAHVEHSFRNVGSGFSYYPTTFRKCYQCGEAGHLAANCPQRIQRVSLTSGTIEFQSGFVDSHFTLW